VPTFSQRSITVLRTAHPDLRRLANEVVKEFDCTPIWAFRDKATQNSFHDRGVSKVRWPDSKHNSLPSLAIDLYPYIDGVVFDERTCLYFAGFVMGTAARLSISIRCGADWDTDWDTNDQTFNDICHFELIDGRP